MHKQSILVVLSVIFVVVSSDFPFDCVVDSNPARRLTPDVFDLNMYWECVQGTLMNRQCGPGTYFNGEIQVQTLKKFNYFRIWNIKQEPFHLSRFAIILEMCDALHANMDRQLELLTSINFNGLASKIV